MKVLDHLPFILDRQVGSNTHDLAELIGGLPRVFVAVPDSPVSAFEDSRMSTSDKVRLPRQRVQG